MVIVINVKQFVYKIFKLSIFNSEKVVLRHTLPFTYGLYISLSLYYFYSLTYTAPSKQILSSYFVVNDLIRRRYIFFNLLCITSSSVIFTSYLCQLEIFISNWWVIFQNKTLPMNINIQVVSMSVYHMWVLIVLLCTYLNVYVGIYSTYICICNLQEHHVCIWYGVWVE